MTEFSNIIIYQVDSSFDRSLRITASVSDTPNGPIPCEIIQESEDVFLIKSKNNKVINKVTKEFLDKLFEQKTYGYYYLREQDAIDYWNQRIFEHLGKLRKKYRQVESHLMNKIL